MPRTIMEIDEDGNVQTSHSGFIGRGCLKFAETFREIARGLGLKIDVEKLEATPEMNGIPLVQRQTVSRK